MATNLNAYTFNPYTRQYIPVVGTPVDNTALRLTVAQIRSKASARLATLASQILSGELTNLAEFAIEFKTELKNLYVATHVLARGGVEQMDVSSWGKLGAALRQQYDYADNFVRDIENERIALGDNVLRRTEMYTESAWGAAGEYENVVRDREFNLGSLERRVLGASEQSCEDCIEAAERGWQPAGLLPDIGDTECGPGCNCTFQFENTELERLQQAFGGSVNLSRSSPKFRQPTKIPQIATAETAQGTLFEKGLKGGQGSGNFSHSGRPGQVGGSSKETDLGMPVGEHTPEGQAKLIKILERETGLKFKPYGSVSTGSTSINDIDIAEIPLTEEEMLAKEDKGRKAEEEVWKKHEKGELTLAQVQEELWGGSPGDDVINTMDRLGFKATKVMNFQGIEVVRFENKKTKHHIEIWRQGSDDYAWGSQDLGKSMKGGAGSGNFNHSGRPGEIGGSTNEHEWLGDKPSEDDRFAENAKFLGLTVKEEKVGTQERDYVVLDRPVILYHATTKDSVQKIIERGIKASKHPGNISGTYLSSIHISNWHGEDTRIVKVKVPKGTKLYRDVQPNAVFVTQDIPKSWLQ